MYSDEMRGTKSRDERGARAPFLISCTSPARLGLSTRLLCYSSLDICYLR